MRDVAAEDLAGVDLQERIVPVEPREEYRHGLEGADERVDEAQRSGLAAGGGLHPPRGAVGAGEHAPAIGKEHDPLGRELDPSRAALEQGDAEQLLERLDLLAHRLLGDVQLPGGAGEAAAFGDGGEVAHLAQIGRCHRSECTTGTAPRRQAEVVAEQQLALVHRSDGRLPSLGDSSSTPERSERWQPCRARISITRSST